MFLMSSFLYSCFESKQNDVAPAGSLVLRGTSTLLIDAKFKDFVGICKITEFQEYEKSFSLDFNNMVLIKFDNENNSNLRAIMIPINTDNVGNKLSKNLIVYFKNNFSSYRFLLTEREGNFNSEGTFSGVTRLKTMDEQVVSEEFVENNKFVKLLTHEVDESTKNARVALQPTCTYNEFNFYYQSIKSSCTNDAVCDIACTASGPVCAAGMALQALDYCMAFDYNP